MAVTTGQRRAVWRRVSPAAGQVLDLLHARMAEPYAPHLHGEFSIGACTDGVEVIRYRTGRHYAGPGSVVILGPDEPHTGGPDGGDFTYRVMYPAAELLSDGSGQVPWFPEPVVIDPASPPSAPWRAAAPAHPAARTACLRFQLVRSFRAEVGMPPYAWLAQYRVGRARILLEQGCRPAEAAAATGFADQAHLTRWFRRVVGVTPGAYRNSVQDTGPRPG